MSRRNVAIVGRPNVGKSALFNRIAHRRIAIVHGQPGITRDRISAECEAAGKKFRLWDTGGIVGAGETALIGDVRVSAERAMAESDLILFVVDAQEGLTPMDRELARFLRRLRKPVLLVVNKIDDPKHEDLAAEFSELGFDNIFSISAAHGRGTPALTDAIVRLLPTIESAGERRAVIARTPRGEVGDSGQSPLPQLRIAIVGRPNAGKSSLINALLRDQRSIVSEIPGTTRDAFDIAYERNGQRYVFIDTAGIRHRPKHSSSVEVFSVMRAEKAIERADLCVLVVDAVDGVRAQDRRIAGLIQKARKACVIALNKWDLVREAVIPSAVEGAHRASFKTTSKGSLRSARDDEVVERKAMEQLIATTRAELFFTPYAPILVTSALTGEYADRIFKMIEKVRRASRAHIGTGKLNRALRDAFASNPPPMVAGKRLKLFYATQAGENEARSLSPPEIVLFVNSPRLLSEPFARFLESKIREVEPYPGLPISLTCRARTSTSS